ncbi:hypothetical protein MCOR02_002225 [Pyricularia oryzae]|uniref:Uncharacterized protein n=1 Tax=Pyricularia oryzae TaxID=318829 RepID=A0A4P7N1G0_PYROR|nr:hypothetical protein MCOR02_002225 [Pyricularia oryzae]QBZ56208.1 hypothetical protein PoMZ_01114 [Pyricularia oryzae]
MSGHIYHQTLLVAGARLLSTRESKMVLVAVGERQPECRHYIPVVHRQVGAMKALGAPHPPPFSSRKSSILASSSHNIRGDPGQPPGPSGPQLCPKRTFARDLLS